MGSFWATAALYEAGESLCHQRVSTCSRKTGNADIQMLQTQNRLKKTKQLLILYELFSYFLCRVYDYDRDFNKDHKKRITTFI